MPFTISKQLLRDLSKNLNKEPSLRPDTLLLVEQLQLFVLRMDSEDRREQDPAEWR